MGKFRLHDRIRVRALQCHSQLSPVLASGLFYGRSTNICWINPAYGEDAHEFSICHQSFPSQTIFTRTMLVATRFSTVVALTDSCSTSYSLGAC